MTDKLLNISDLRKEAEGAYHSALGEYCPKTEFFHVLDRLEKAEARVVKLADALAKIALRGGCGHDHIICHSCYDSSHEAKIALTTAPFGGPPSDLKGPTGFQGPEGMSRMGPDGISPELGTQGMTLNDYVHRINLAGGITGLEARGWNKRYRASLAQLGLELKPSTYRDPTGNMLDSLAPTPHPDDPFDRWHKDTRIGVKSE